MPNRILKDSICTSDSIASLSDFHEAFFYRLIVNCDDFGRMDARPAILKARLYPLRERLTLKDIESALRALADVGCVEVYEVDGKPYLRLPSWEVHQQIRAKKSKYPAPENVCNQMISNDSKCPRNPIQSESNPNPIRIECGDAPARARVSIPTFEQVLEVAKLHGCPELARPFFDYYAAAGWRDSEGKPVYNWQQKFVLWRQREEKRNKRCGQPVGGNVFLDMLREEEDHGQS